MKLTASDREAALKFFGSVEGQSILKYVESKKPVVSWEAKTSIESYAIAASEGNGFVKCLEELKKVYQPKEND